MTDENRRQPGEAMKDWRPRRDKLARALAGLGDPKPEDGRIGGLASALEAVREDLASLGLHHGHRAEQLKALELRVAAIEKAADPEITIKLEDRPGFVFCQSDQFALTMAAMVAMRGGEADLILKGGTVIERLRMGELAEVARQALLAGGGDAAG